MIVLLFLLKSHIEIFQLNINLRLAALCTVFIHVTRWIYLFYIVFVFYKAHTYDSMHNYFTSIFNDVLFVTSNIFLLIGCIKSESKYVLLWICTEVFNFSNDLTDLVQNISILFHTSYNVFEEFYPLWIIYFGKFALILLKFLLYQ